MKTPRSKSLQALCRARFPLAVVLGLGIGWAMSSSLGVAVGFAIGGAVTVSLLATRRS